MEKSMYRVVEREKWERLRKENPDVFGEKPKWLSRRRAIYTGDYPPEVVMTYPEVLEIAAKVIELLPIGNVVVDSDLNFYDAEDEVLRIVHQCLQKRNGGE
ncbi:hypothetical protein [Desulfurobacterium sp.]